MKGDDTTWPWSQHQPHSLRYISSWDRTPLLLALLGILMLVLHQSAVKKCSSKDLCGKSNFSTCNNKGYNRDFFQMSSFSEPHNLLDCTSSFLNSFLKMCSQSCNVLDIWSSLLLLASLTSSMFCSRNSLPSFSSAMRLPFLRTPCEEPSLSLSLTSSASSWASWTTPLNAL